jgi:hypothetical protein
MSLVRLSLAVIAVLQLSFEPRTNGIPLIVGEWRDAPRLWIQATPVWRFRPVADDAQMKELAARAWGPESRDVRVTGSRTIGGKLWSEIELITGHDCGRPGADVVRVRGWVPAHAASGDLNVWYYPRGC